MASLTTYTARGGSWVPKTVYRASGGVWQGLSGFVTQTVDSVDTGTGDTYINTTGTWQTASNAGDFGGTDIYTDGTGAVGGTWTGGTGTQIKIYADTDTHHGKCIIAIDGTDQSPTDLYTATRVNNALVFTSATLSAGAHSWSLRWTGTKNASSTGTVVVFDEAVIAVCTPRAAPPPPPPSSFVTRNGTNLVNGSDTSWQFVGFNSYTLGHGCGINGEDFDGTTRPAVFAAMRQDGHAVVRTWCFPNYNNPTDLAVLQQTLDDAAAHNIKIIFTLCSANNNDCSDSSGASNQSAFYGSTGNGTWTGTYKTWIQKVVPMFKNHTALLAWEVINEPKGDTTGILPFYKAATALIRSLDPNHLISSGTQPIWSFANDGANGNSSWGGGTNANAWGQVNATCDISSMHEYDYSQSPSGWFAPTLAAAQSINRPLMVGEFGITDGTYSGTTRATHVEAKLGYYVGSANPGACGALYWSLVHANQGGDNLTYTDPVFSTVRSHSIPA